VPRFGLAHCTHSQTSRSQNNATSTLLISHIRAGLALGLGPWLATEVPELVSTGIIVASAAGAAGGAAAKP
jgi:hypothetical protein